MCRPAPAKAPRRSYVLRYAAVRVIHFCVVMSMSERRHADAGVVWWICVWALVLAYFVAGVLGRSLWKADEPYSFGIVWEILEDHQWLIPHVADQPFVEKPPLVYWLAAGFAKALPYFRPDESARLVVFLFAAISVAALYAAARRLRDEAMAWSRVVEADVLGGAKAVLNRHAYASLGVLLMAGTLGFAEHVHKLTADIGQLAGALMGLCGLIYVATASNVNAQARTARRSGISGGVMVGTGAGIAFMSKGLFVPGVLFTTCALLLPLPVYRSRHARWAFAIAAVTAIPWLVVWPMLFYAQSPQLFGEWLWGHNVGRFLGYTVLGGNHRTLVDKLSAISAMGLPTILLLPLVASRTLRTARSGNSGHWTLSRCAPAHVGVAVFLLVAITVLAASASMRDIYVLPLLPAIVLLGLPALLLRSCSSESLRRIAIGAFGGMLVLAGAVWFALVTTGDFSGLPRLTHLVGRTLPLPYPLAVSWVAIAVTVGAIAAWSYVIRRDVSRSIVVAWSAGFATIWLVTVALLLPWIDAARSYESVFREISSHVSSFQRCVAAANMGESELSLLEYLTGIEATRAFLGHSGSGKRANPNPAMAQCDWLIVLSSRRSHIPQLDLHHWRPVSAVSRLANDDEQFILYRAVDRE